jgi:hypothetical protein
MINTYMQCMHTYIHKCIRIYVSCLFCDISNLFCDISNLFCDMSNVFCDISCLFCDISCLFCDLSNLFCDISNVFSDISNLFCGISIRCSRVVPKQEVDKVVTCSFKISTSLNKSEFTIVADSYRPLHEILIIIL